MPCREGGRGPDERVIEASGAGGAMEGTTRCTRVVGALAHVGQGRAGVRVAKYRGRGARESFSWGKEAAGEDGAERRENAPGVAYQRTDTRVGHVVHGYLSLTPQPQPKVPKCVACARWFLYMFSLTI
jgi:hypothetical protein